MVKLAKSEKNLSEWCVAMVKTSLSTSSLPVGSVVQQHANLPSSHKDCSGIVIDESSASKENSTQQEILRSIGDEEQLTLLMPNPLITTTPCAHLTPNSAVSLSSMGRPVCRICHLVNETCRNPLVSPCRCSGTMQFVHIGCLVHWLEISAKKMYPQPRCELCGYNYKRHPCVDLKRVHVPRIDVKDVTLNGVFLFALVVMVVCAVLGVHFLRVTDQYRSLRLYRVSPTPMNNDDLTVITCSVLFFIAFFIAVFTQYRAEASIFRVFFRFWLINRNWQIRNYDISDDPEMLVEKQERSEKVDVTANNERYVMLA
ncbi:unnamed protein product [Anisakis simplex]|uniref:RING-CH-type domain-containing protein n=1 Tax=Anisakis simplex TaxID=6269 RepID=A0A0M3JUG9_ANISI|nr:unnamed protein product [Anisakis simplex]